MQRDLAPVLPATVSVTFRPSPCGNLGWGDVPPWYPVQVALASAGLPVTTGAPATWSIRDTCHAVFAQAGAPKNSGNLQALANQMAKDFWGWRLVAFDRHLVGVVAPVPDGTIGALAWRYTTAGCSTRMATEPTGGESVALGHDDARTDCDANPQLLGGTDDLALAKGVLTIPQVELYIDDGILKWLRLAPQSVTICPSTASAQAMTTEDGNAMTTE